MLNYKKSTKHNSFIIMNYLRCWLQKRVCALTHFLDPNNMQVNKIKCRYMRYVVVFLNVTQEAFFCATSDTKVVWRVLVIQSRRITHSFIYAFLFLIIAPSLLAQLCMMWYVTVLAAIRRLFLYGGCQVFCSISYFRCGSVSGL